MAGCGTVGSALGVAEDTVEPPAELEEIEPLIKVRTLWSRDLGAGADKQYLTLKPVVVGGRAYGAGRKGEIVAYDAATGESLWKTSLNVPISGGPGMGAGLVLVGTSDGEVIAVRAEDGELAWRAPVSSEVLASPVASDKMVIVRTGDGKLFGLNREDGARVWVYDRTVPVLTLRGTSAPVLASDSVIAGFDSGRMVSVELGTGQPLWETRVAAPKGRSELERMVDIDADPVVAGDLVYVVTFQGHITALDLRTGASVWRRDMSSHTGIGIDAQNLYVSDELSHVWAVDRFNSASLWRQKKLQGRRLTSPVVFGEYVVVGDFEGYVHWLRREDGQFAARVKVGEGIIAGPVASADAVYIFDRGGTLTALQPAGP